MSYNYLKEKVEKYMLEMMKKVNECIDVVNKTSFNLNKVVGPLTTLKTNDKTSFANAINEINDILVKVDADKVAKTIGDVNTLKASDKSNVVAAINEVYDDAQLALKNVPKSIGTQNLFKSSIYSPKINFSGTTSTIVGVGENGHRITPKSGESISLSCVLNVDNIDVDHFNPNIVHSFSFSVKPQNDMNITVTIMGGKSETFKCVKDIWTNVFLTFNFTTTNHEIDITSDLIDNNIIVKEWMLTRGETNVEWSKSIYEYLLENNTSVIGNLLALKSFDKTNVVNSLNSVINQFKNLHASDYNVVRFTEVKGDLIYKSFNSDILKQEIIFNLSVSNKKTPFKVTGSQAYVSDDDLAIYFINSSNILDYNKFKSDMDLNKVINPQGAYKPITGGNETLIEITGGIDVSNDVSGYVNNVLNYLGYTYQLSEKDDILKSYNDYFNTQSLTYTNLFAFKFLNNFGHKYTANEDMFGHIIVVNKLKKVVSSSKMYLPYQFYS